MSLVRRLILVAAAVVVVLGVVALGTFAWVARQFRDVLVLEVEGPKHLFQFLVDPPFLDEGDPSVLLAVVDPDHDDRRTYHLLGFIDWGDLDHIEEWIHLETGEVGDVGYVVRQGEAAKPLVLWNTASGAYVPTLDDLDLKQPWVSKALGDLADKTGEMACLAWLSAHTVECRWESPRIEPSGSRVPGH